MGKYNTFVVMFLFMHVIHEARQTLSRQVVSETSEMPATAEDPTPRTTSAYPPSDPNDACRGCPPGQVCTMVIPPCAMPRECREPDPDPVFECEKWAGNCRPQPLCLDYQISLWN